jgi:hypothetical protein
MKWEGCDIYEQWSGKDANLWTMKWGGCDIYEQWSGKDAISMNNEVGRMRYLWTMKWEGCGRDRGVTADVTSIFTRARRRKTVKTVRSLCHDSNQEPPGYETDVRTSRLRISVETNLSNTIKPATTAHNHLGFWTFVHHPKFYVTRKHSVSETRSVSVFR